MAHSNARPRLLLGGLFTLLWIAGAGAAPAQEEISQVPLATTSQRAKFIAVNLGDESRKADEKLAEYLNNMVPTVYFVLELASYETVVESLANWSSDDAFIARVTPYVYLAAEALGAELVPLASYESRATEDYTYRSYLVVRKKDLTTDQPNPEDVIKLISALNAKKLRARFRFHSRFSTSSYYLPARFFLQHHVFNMDEPAGTLRAIESRKIDSDSSSDLVRLVARGVLPGSAEEAGQEGREAADGADIVAVWDGTKAKFCKATDRAAERLKGLETRRKREEDDPEETAKLAAAIAEAEAALREARGKETTCDALHFIPLDTLLPNDLLVASSSMDDWTKTRIQTAITTMGDRAIDIDDFVRWEDIRQAHQARTALLALIRESRQAPSKITIDVRADKESRPPVLAWQKKAVEEAIELSGTEFTVWERYFHRKADFEWTLKLTHDGALELTSQPNGFRDAKKAVQNQIMSFEDKIDLIDRTTVFIASRMHRVRYIWPYWDRPTVIRDLPFALPESGTPLQVSKIEWEEFERNGYLTDPNEWFEAPVEHSDFHKLQLDAKAFPKTFPRTAAGDLMFDPMSNVWYRVLLVREAKESDLMRALTWAFIVILTLGAVGAALDFYRPDWLAALWRRGFKSRASSKEAHA